MFTIQDALDYVNDATSGEDAPPPQHLDAGPSATLGATLVLRAARRARTGSEARSEALRAAQRYLDLLPESLFRTENMLVSA